MEDKEMAKEIESPNTPGEPAFWLVREMGGEPVGGYLELSEAEAVMRQKPGRTIEAQ